MIIVRDVFRTKPGKAKDLVQRFKKALPMMKSEGIHNSRVMTDIVANYWTVVIETEADDLAVFEKHMRSSSPNPEVGEIMKGYMDSVESGYREIFKIE
jgi:hypothetical protein